MDASTTSSLCVDTRALKVTNNNSSSKTYIRLGLKKTINQHPKNPKVLSLLSSLLERSVKNNETTRTNDVLTIFHGSRTPTLTIRHYIDRIFKYFHCSPSCFVVAKIYIDRFIQSGAVNLTSRSVHRLIITGIVIATKFIDDSFFNNAYYAKVGGVTTTELNRLEMKFLFGIDFRLYVGLHTFDKYCSQLEAQVLQIQPPLQVIVCGTKKNSSSNDDSSFHPTNPILSLDFRTT